tara:strand:+ start:624 stop:1133 length:510 start_codon:yes stop_codon:yes gene_type:complete
MKLSQSRIRQIIREELQSLVEQEPPKRFLGMSVAWLLKKGWAWSPEENDFFKGEYRLSKTVARWKVRKAQKTQGPAPAAVKGAGLAAIKPTKGGPMGPAAAPEGESPEVTKRSALSHDWNTEECPYSWWDPRGGFDPDCPTGDWDIGGPGSGMSVVKQVRQWADLFGGD